MILVNRAERISVAERSGASITEYNKSPRIVFQIGDYYHVNNII